ncbi:subunit of tubulin prefoldin [Coniosporium apollinis]|uniref:Subunit of tubulin prefoldin n=2 Tax=Coniosporium TaxID=2810619 RepID=A0ABQ9P243_9PEZI|nr:subunit of tubulin prefoldin [Cladosporium sp. JES 115]KAJ9668630.1 subunit of tubulin prefoldin [Coniosporium apollinis]
MNGSRGCFNSSALVEGSFNDTTLATHRERKRGFNALLQSPLPRCISSLSRCWSLKCSRMRGSGTRWAVLVGGELGDTAFPHPGPHALRNAKAALAQSGISNTSTADHNDVSGNDTDYDTTYNGTGGHVLSLIEQPVSPQLVKAPKGMAVLFEPMLSDNLPTTQVLLTMSSSAAQPGGQTIDLAALSVQQLSQLKKQLDSELEHLTTSFQSLSRAQAKFKDCLKSISDGLTAKKADSPILVPLTPSLYVPGRLTDVSTVLVDVGTGFYVEKSTADAQDFYKRKIEDLSRNLKELEAIVQGKGKNLSVVEEVIRQKVLAGNAGAAAGGSTATAAAA